MNCIFSLPLAFTLKSLQMYEYIGMHKHDTSKYLLLFTLSFIRYKRTQPTKLSVSIPWMCLFFVSTYQNQPHPGLENSLHFDVNI